jgi:hypothetical protein
MTRSRTLTIASVALLLAGGTRTALAQGTAADTATVSAAHRLLDAAERELAVRSVALNRAGWIGENFITHDTELLAADAQADAGAMWRAGYDMPPDSFVAVVDKLWREVRPLYVQLHAYVRRRLMARYGATLVAPNGMLPVHLLGNMWGQDWSNIADLAVPVGTGGGSGVDLTAILKARNVAPLDMVRTGERFYVSLGFDSLPATFWERSLFVRPRDRDVVCHASAWYIDDPTDLRIKMCIEPNADEFRTIHHELGHDYYFRAYKDQPFLYQAGANDGFQEAIGDAIALSITPRYLKEIGLLDSEPAATGDTLDLLRQALDHVAFLPFGITMGRRLNAMLQLGASRPWPDALATLTGQRQMDATALLDYFQPLLIWLERQNRGAPVGW